MHYYIIILVIIICILIFVTYYFLTEKRCDCKKDVLPNINHITNNLTEIFIENRKSQFYQDIMMYFKYFVNKNDGLFVELGALDGISYSNSYFFEKNFNWHGILIEGGPVNCRNLFQNANKRSNSKIVCSPICKSEYTNFRDNGPVGMLYKTTSSSRKIKCNTLSNITNFYNVKHIDFFTLDVEGSELEVLQTFDFNVTVSYWLIEWPHLNNTTKDEIIDLLKRNGYVLSKEYISEIDVLFSHV